MHIIRSRVTCVVAIVAVAMVAALTTRAAATQAAATHACKVRQAWTCLRTVLPAGVSVLRPAWLPRRFSGTPIQVDVHNDRIVGIFYEVGYRSGRGDVLSFNLGGANSSTITSDSPVRVRGVMGHLVTTSGWPAIEVTWREYGHFYAVQAHGVDRAEMLRIVSHLVPVASHAVKRR